MNRPRVTRLLRITWTVCCGIACVLLCVLWVRSYSRCDGIYKQLATGTYLTVASTNGVVFIREEARRLGFGDIPKNWEFRSQQAVIGNPNFQWVHDPGFTLIQFPDLALLLMAVAATVIPWIRSLHWRFSLRTLLIATTLVAVLLGTVVVLSR